MSSYSPTASLAKDLRLDRAGLETTWSLVGKQKEELMIYERLCRRLGSGTTHRRRKKEYGRVDHAQNMLFAQRANQDIKASVV